MRNGLRQGGILLQSLFNLCMNKLSLNLTQLGVGCIYNDIIVNHLFYADGTVLMGSSPAALQKLISESEKSFNKSVEKVCYCF